MIILLYYSLVPYNNIIMKTEIQNRNLYIIFYLSQVSSFWAWSASHTSRHYLIFFTSSFFFLVIFVCLFFIGKGLKIFPKQSKSLLGWSWPRPSLSPPGLDLSTLWSLLCPLALKDFQLVWNLSTHFLSKLKQAYQALKRDLGQRKPPQHTRHPLERNIEFFKRS